MAHLFALESEAFGMKQLMMAHTLKLISENPSQDAEKEGSGNIRSSKCTPIHWKRSQLYHPECIGKGY